MSVSKKRRERKRVPAHSYPRLEKKRFVSYRESRKYEEAERSWTAGSSATERTGRCVRYVRCRIAALLVYWRGVPPLPGARDAVWHTRVSSAPGLLRGTSANRHRRPAKLPFCAPFTVLFLRSPVPWFWFLVRRNGDRPMPPSVGLLTTAAAALPERPSCRWYIGFASSLHRAPPATIAFPTTVASRWNRFEWKKKK